MTAVGTAPARSTRSRLVPVYAGVAAVFTGQQLLTPLLPALARELGLAPFAVGVVVSTAAVLGVVLSPVWGRYCQRWGLKRMMVGSVLGSGLALLAFALAAGAGLAGVLGATTCLVLLVATRGVVFGVTCSAVPVVAQSYVSAMTQGERDRVRGIAGLGACVGIGVVAGPSLGGLLAGIDLRVPLYVPAVLVLAAGLLLAAVLRPERLTEQAREPARLSPFDRRVWPYLLFAFVTFLTLTVSQVTLGFLLQDRLGLAPEAAAARTGLLLMAMGGGLVLMQLVVVPRLGWRPRRLIWTGTLAGLLAFTALVLLDDLPSMFVALTVSGAGIGLASSGFMSAPTLLVPAEAQGTVAGYLASADGVAFVLGPLAATALYEVDPLAPYVAGGVLLALLLVFAVAHGREGATATGSGD
ncbi:MFS transporter [Amycolatopsis antarctica]|uniref:MFS transporter n=1 Tax=Amycolatopsis antarctica TaxID=1854586 RepID=UPI0013FD192F|nr:MFS transporter [Amycolatopsis antarctica]